MSSWKNAAKSNQKTHRERKQPRDRQHLGLLEKKKDYVKRATDFHDKETTLKLLRKRALDKNPDEFYHHMINSTLKKGVHHNVEKGDEHTPEQIKLMQTQDLKYINMKRTIEANNIKRLQSELHMIDAADSTPNTHTFFVDNDDELENFDVVKHLGTHPSLMQRKSNRLRISDLETMKLPDIDRKAAKAMKLERAKSYKRLAKRIEREKELTVIQQKMELKKSLLDKKVQKPKRIKAGTKDSAPIYKWKYERKR